MTNNTSPPTLDELLTASHIRTAVQALAFLLAKSSVLKEPSIFDMDREDALAALRDNGDAILATLRTCAANSQNAARYEWLKANHLQLGPDCWIRTGEDLDEAIDAELAAQSGDAKDPSHG